MDIEDFQPGDWVEYINGPDKERGRVKSTNNLYVFVVYKCDGKWDKFKDYTAVATDRELLLRIYGPIEGFPLSEFINDEIMSRGWTISELSKLSDIENLNTILENNLIIDYEISRKLSIVFETSEDLFLNIDNSYRQYLKKCIQFAECGS